MLGRRRSGGWVALALVGLVGGCGSLAPRRPAPPPHSSAGLLDTGPTARITARQAADVQFAVGRTHEEGGRLDEAAASYRSALARDAKRADVEARLAIVLDQQGSAREADQHFERAMKLAPQDPEILCDRGYCLHLRGQADAAERSLRAALAVAPKHPRSHTNLALVLAGRGDSAGAMAEFARAGTDPSDARANLALALALGGKVEAARDQYALALAAKPGSPAAVEGLRVASTVLSRAGAGQPAIPADLPRLPGEPRPAAVASARPAPSRVDPAVVPTAFRP